MVQLFLFDEGNKMISYDENKEDIPERVEIVSLENIDFDHTIIEVSMGIKKNCPIIFVKKRLSL